MLLAEINKNLKNKDLLSFVSNNFSFFIRYLYKTVEKVIPCSVKSINGNDIANMGIIIDSLLSNKYAFDFFSQNHDMSLDTTTGEINIEFHEDNGIFNIKIYRDSVNSFTNFAYTLESSFSDFAQKFEKAMLEIKSSGFKKKKELSFASTDMKALNAFLKKVYLRFSFKKASKTSDSWKIEIFSDTYSLFIKDIVKKRVLQDDEKLVQFQIDFLKKHAKYIVDFFERRGYYIDEMWSANFYIILMAKKTQVKDRKDIIIKKFDTLESEYDYSLDDFYQLVIRKMFE